MSPPVADCLQWQTKPFLLDTLLGTIYVPLCSQTHQKSRETYLIPVPSLRHCPAGHNLRSTVAYTVGFVLPVGVFCSTLMSSVDVP